MNIHVVQIEEGSGIPGEPMLFLIEEEAEEAYRAAWREGRRRQFDTEAELDAFMATDEFDTSAVLDWPEDGGVRWWVIPLSGVRADDPTERPDTVQLVAVFEAATHMADRMFEALHEEGRHLSCGEYESVVSVFRALGYAESVAILLDPEADHVANDEADDEHFVATAP